VKTSLKLLYDRENFFETSLRALPPTLPMGWEPQGTFLKI